MPRRSVNRPDTPCDQGSASGTFCLESRLRPSQQPGDVGNWPKADMSIGRFDVRFQGKADMTFCTAHVR
jgi:hypothetical protein